MTLFFASFIRYSNLGTIIFPSLVKLFLAISRPCIGLLCWLDSSMGLCFCTIFVHPCFGQSFLRFHLVLSFRRTYLRFIFPLRKAYGLYILASKDFIHPCLFASRGSLWINSQKMKDFHTIMYILENTSYIYIYIYLKIQTYANIRPQAWHMLKS